MSLAIVFIHRGYSSYLEFTLRQAKYSSPNSEIILLGDEANNRFDFITHINMKNYFKQADGFAKIYQHYSTNPYKYELFCFQRWFLLKEFMEQSRIDKLMVCDSDILIYCNVDELDKKYFRDYDFSASIHSKQVASAEISFWRIDIIKDFCAFMTMLYTNKESLARIKGFYEDLKNQNSLGGYCDMSVVHDYTEQFSGKLSNTQAVVEDAACDSIINNLHAGGYEYEFKYGKKKILWRDGLPYCYNKNLDKDIRFLLIHFQGPAKYLISHFYTGKTFSGKLYLDIKFFFVNIAAFWYKTLRIRYRLAWLFDIIFKLREK